uniref:CHK kinase-like domain-containing protein n=1 Tax=Globodera rostochiensis TaxID=31243 RepID=A0A914GXN3_GLORO
MSSSPIVTRNKSAIIPNTNFTVQFVIDTLNSAGQKCPKIWQICAKNLAEDKIQLECLSGTGFLSAISRITFFCKSSPQQFSAIMKVPTAEIVRQKCPQFTAEEIGNIASMIGNCHKVELAFYTQIVPKYFRAVPKLSELIPQIYAFGDTFILMEDLTSKGAHRDGAMDDSDQKMVESIVEAMALLHVHSLAIPKSVLENLFRPQTTLQSGNLSNQMVHQRICSMNAPMGPYFRKHSDDLATFLESTESGPEVERHIARHLGIDMPVLCHGDLWLNNLLFDGNDGRVSGILDWQFAHVGNGISDIVHFLLNAVDADLRQRHTARWLQLYHDVVRAECARNSRCFIGTTSLVPAADAAGECRARITLQQLRALYAALFPCHLHMEISTEAFLNGGNETADADDASKLSKMIWTRICAAFDEYLGNQGCQIGLY